MQSSRRQVSRAQLSYRRGNRQSRKLQTKSPTEEGIAWVSFCLFCDRLRALTHRQSDDGFLPLQFRMPRNLPVHSYEQFLHSINSFGQITVNRNIQWRSTELGDLFLTGFAQFFRHAFQLALAQKKKRLLRRDKEGFGSFVFVRLFLLTHGETFLTAPKSAAHAVFNLCDFRMRNHRLASVVRTTFLHRQSEQQRPSSKISELRSLARRAEILAVPEPIGHVIKVSEFHTLHIVKHCHGV